MWREFKSTRLGEEDGGVWRRRGRGGWEEERRRDGRVEWGGLKKGHVHMRVRARVCVFQYRLGEGEGVGWPARAVCVCVCVLLPP